MARPVYVPDISGRDRRVALGALILLYHRRSGLTHFLAPPAPQILEALAERPASAEELLARLSEHYDLGADAETALAARLDELEAAGLVRRR